MTRARSWALRIGVVAVVSMAAGSAWAIAEGGGPAVNGGSPARVHDGCSFPDSAEPSGNWTHGDYVSAWAQAAGGDSASVRDAAHSSCGKPVSAHGPHRNDSRGHGHSKEPPGRPAGS
jgi:hypothetical protein